MSYHVPLLFTDSLWLGCVCFDVQTAKLCRCPSHIYDMDLFLIALNHPYECHKANLSYRVFFDITLGGMHRPFDSSCYPGL